ncbi:DUF421 domain-containing protein [Winogradskyella wichelsiae]|uniref:DUF421 domain-containing protein n=1 Tax=Winogradskyella wichelsiae TaxID=2697007 RepID=UPI0015C80473|nr:YetF domain-containing protein [Winogradskyella wichelsiae]
MDDWFKFSTDESLSTIITVIGIYITLIMVTRLNGKRSFSKISRFDIAMTVSIGSVLATVIVSKSMTLQYAILGLVIIYSLQMLVVAIRHWKPIQSLVDNKPTFLMKNGQLLRDNLKKCKVTESDVKAKLREANVIRLSEVKAIIFESTGDISILHGTDDKLIDDWIVDF